MTAVGDLIVGGASGTPARLAAGTDGHVLTLAGGAPAWSAASGGSLLVAETVVTGSAVTSVTFSGLDGNDAGGYLLLAEVINATSNQIEMYISVNGDTTITNYYSQILLANGTTITTANVNEPRIGRMDASKKSDFDISIKCNSGYFRYISKSMFGSGSTQRIYTLTGDKTASVTNITALAITSTAANSIAVGSTFRLYKRK